VRTRLVHVCGALLLVASSACAAPASEQRSTTGAAPAATSAPQATPVASGGAILSYAAESEPDFVNPAIVDPNIPSQLVFRGLTKYDDTNTLQPDLAKSWDVSSDKLTYTFHLRDDAKWHDGQPFTAADVKFTLDTILNKDSNSSQLQNFQEVKSVDVIDDHTVKLTLGQLFAPLLDKLTVGMVPKHLLEGKDPRQADFNKQPIGTGPFKVAEWRKGEFMTLQADPNYYGGKPKLDKIVLKFVTDASQRLLQLQNGEVDSAFLEPKQVAQFKDSDKVQLYIWNTADFRVILLNMRNPMLADAKVRTALNYAVARDAIVKSVLVGYGEPAYSPLQQSPYNNASVDHFSYDPNRVKSLMTAAGWALGSDGVWAKDGKRFAFTLVAPANDPVRVDLANVAATSLKANGVEVKVDPRGWDYILKNWASIDLMVLGWGGPFDPDEYTYKLFHSSQALENGGSNLGDYSNPKVDQLLQQARTTVDDAQRKQLYGDFQKELNADPPYIWGTYLQAIHGVSKKIQGPKEKLLGHHGIGFFSNAEEWSMK